MSAALDTELRRRTRRMLRALDGYWHHWERTGLAETWWDVFERERKAVEELLAAAGGSTP